MPGNPEMLGEFVDLLLTGKTHIESRNRAPKDPASRDQPI
jgi:hypothetical protein